jgi:hypothetical protein
MKTKLKTLLSKTLGQVENQYNDGRINQSEYELYTHIWNKLHEKHCNCAFCVIEQGDSEKLYSWLLEISYNNCAEFFDAIRWPEGHIYCMRSKEYFDHTGFNGIQKTLNTIIEKVKTNTVDDYYNI